nr:hypothetical protein [Allomuricauda sp.]
MRTKLRNVMDVPAFHPWYPISKAISLVEDSSSLDKHTGYSSLTN